MSGKADIAAAPSEADAGDGALRRARSSGWSEAKSGMRHHGADLPVGQKSVQPRLQKDSASRLTQITFKTLPIPSHKRGVSRSSRPSGEGCGGRGVAIDERRLTG